MGLSNSHSRCRPLLCTVRGGEKNCDDVSRHQWHFRRRNYHAHASGVLGLLSPTLGQFSHFSRVPFSL